MHINICMYIYMHIYIYIYIKCIVTNKYASRVLEYVECPRRTETSHFFIKSLELKCHVHIFSLFVYIYIYMRILLLFRALDIKS